MLLAIQLFMDAWCSFRGAARALSLFAKLSGIPCPSYSTIRLWVYRLGHYCLTQAPAFVGDWVMITDHTVQLGNHKCMATLGVDIERFKSGNYCLSHKDVRLLDLDITVNPTGEQIGERFIEIVERYGYPVQIVADNGADLKKGYKVLCSSDPEAPDPIQTYDITHLIAIELKHELRDDLGWQSFINEVTNTRSRVKQTGLQFLAPPKLRSQARFMNLDPILKWTTKVLAFLKRQDFSGIGAGFGLSKKFLRWFVPHHSTVLLSNLFDMSDRHFATKDQFIETTRRCIGEQAFAKFGVELTELADLGREKAMEQFGWLQDVEALKAFTEIQDIALVPLSVIKKKGLGLATFQEAAARIAKLDVTTTRAQAFGDKVTEAVKVEAAKIPKGMLMLGCSDVIESIFGKYKQISSRSPLKTMGQLVLTLPLMTATLTVDLVKQAMENISNYDLEQWVSDNLGTSELALRRRTIPGPKTEKNSAPC